MYERKLMETLNIFSSMTAFAYVFFFVVPLLIKIDCPAAKK